MKLSPVMNIIGVLLLGGAIILHIVCLSTPNVAAAESNQAKMQKKIKELIEEKRKQKMSPEEIQSLQKAMMENGMMMSANINYGLWKLCVQTHVQAFSIDFCAKWASETKTTQTGQASSLKMPGWMRGCQATSIIGLLVAAGAGVMSLIHLCVPSKGDRLRLLPLFVCIAAFVGGAFILCANIIFAAKYYSIPEFLIQNEIRPPPEVLKIVEDLFFLSWGFALDIVSAALLLLSGLFHILANRVSQQSGMV